MTMVQQGGPAWGRQARPEANEEKGDYYRCEIGSGEFSRTVALPCVIDAAKASVQLKDGVLEVTLPKGEKSKRCAARRPRLRASATMALRGGGID